MNSMEEIRLSEYADIFSGYAFSTNDMKDEGVPILKIGNINSDGTITLTSDSNYPYEVPKKLDKFWLRKSDFLVCMTGATIGKIGRSFCVKEKQCLVNQRVGIIRSKGNINNDYLYYILTLSDFKRYIEIVGSGAAQANISASDIGKFTLQCNKNEKIQNKIAKTLSNYDLLIENNNKRIKLLEKMAEELYKEWFVRFRVPGYELVQTKIQNVKGWTFGDNENGQIIPERWHFGELKTLAEFIRGKNITSTEMIEGPIPVISAGLEPSGYHNASNVEGYNLTISSSGANAGYLSYHLEDIWAADCSYYNNKNNLWFVYHALKFLQPVIKNMQIGSAQPHVYAKNINRISTIIPSQELIDLFMEKVKPLYEEIKVLKQKNEFLKKQRDSLLPRLMSGKIDLEDKEVI